MTAIAAIGHLSRDVVAEDEPRPGGGVLYASRALSRLGADARLAASCAAGDRPLLLPPLEASGLPLTWHESRTTAAYSFGYEGDRRTMRQDAVGDPWSPEQATAGAGDAGWVHVAALARTDFPPRTLEALAAGGRTLLLDAHGLVRAPALGPLRLEAPTEPVLEHVAILKLDDEEAAVLVGGPAPERLRSLGVPEVVLTLGSRGAWVVTAELTELVPAERLEGPVDPTGAGDAFSAAYLCARSQGAEPVEAARAATRTVAQLLAPG